ncbi:sulfatase family protein [Tichowtungia aerotolerans]|uniref:Sulfatase-like hydrolase/transferase n=1 Tax=Tichowtungia aerotolerans TaxID=2697043 RepID=A0A6P1M8A3_9BACT|nr:sulfatase [Tichowtungia aerotolerans]QHI70117.1 sulfatase-like hydrolase/transferase [Tichowtungia aerotolerans]
MKRRDYLRSLGLGAGACLLGSNAFAAKRRQPNLLFVFPDQMRREAMGFWQQGRFKGVLPTLSDPVYTPVLDQLAQESVVFTQAVSTCPVCSPYRAMLMSGMWPWQNGVVNNCHQNRRDSLRHDIDCFTDVLRNAGYSTCYVGKTHWEMNKPLFDENQNYVGVTEAPGGHYINAYDTYIPPGRGRHSNDYWFQCVKDVHKDPYVYSNRPEQIEGKKDGIQYRPKLYSPKLEADVVIDYLQNNTGQRDGSKPFSIIWAPNPPHSPYGSEKDCDEVVYRELYKGKEGLLNRPNVTGENKALAEKRAPFYFSNVTGIDKQLGRILQVLEESGEADNTIVVFTADHGEMMGSHNKFGKLVIYEEAFCVPLMIKYPGKTKGTLEDLMITPPDIMPTVLGLLGLEDRIPETVEGKNYSREIISGDWATQSKPKSAHFLGFNSKFRGLRTDRYTYQIDETGEQMLFDNKNDPYQMTKLQLTDIPEADADFILSELGMWLKQSGDPWFRQKKLSSVIKYP